MEIPLGVRGALVETDDETAAAPASGDLAVDGVFGTNGSP